MFTIKNRPKVIPKVVSALTARTQLGQIIKQASEQNERFIVRRRGEPKVVIMGLKDFIETIAPVPKFLKEIHAEARRKGLDKLAMWDIDALIAEIRRERREKSR